MAIFLKLCFGFKLKSIEKRSDWGCTRLSSTIIRTVMIERIVVARIFEKAQFEQTKKNLHTLQVIAKNLSCMNFFFFDFNRKTDSLIDWLIIFFPAYYYFCKKKEKKKSILKQMEQWISLDDFNDWFFFDCQFLSKQ